MLTQYGVSNVTAISASSTYVIFGDLFSFPIYLRILTLPLTYYPSYHPTVSPTSNDQILNSVPSSGTDYLSLTFLLVYVSASLCLIALCMVLFYFRLYGAYFRFKDTMSVKDLHDTDFGIFEWYESPSDVMPYRADSIGFKESKVENFLNYDDTSNISSINGLYHRNYGPKDESRPASNLSSPILGDSYFKSNLEIPSNGFDNSTFIENDWANSLDSIGVVFDEIFVSENNFPRNHQGALVYFPGK